MFDVCVLFWWIPEYTKRSGITVLWTTRFRALDEIIFTVKAETNADNVVTFNNRVVGILRVTATSGSERMKFQKERNYYDTQECSTGY